MEHTGQVCTVRDVCTAVVAVASVADPPREERMPQCLKEVLDSWGSTWMWKALRLVGDNVWIRGVIERGTLIAVTDGSYMRELLPNLCSAAFILECSEGSGRIVGTFAEASSGANAYRGELLGLMAVHLILLAANELWPRLHDQVVVLLDCLWGTK